MAVNREDSNGIPPRPSRRMSEEDEEEMRPSRRRRAVFDEDEPKAQGSEGRQRLMLVAAAVIVSFLVVMIWGNATLVSKKDFEANVANIVDDIGKISSSIPNVKGVSDTVDALNRQLGNMGDKVDAVSKEVADVESSMGNYAKSDSVAEVKSRLGDVQNSISSLQSQVNSIKPPDTSELVASIDALDEQVASLETRIKVLEVGGIGESGTSPGKAIQISVKTLGYNALSPIDNRDLNNNLGAGDGVYDGLQGSMRMTLTNTTIYDIDDAVIDLEFAIYPSMPSYTPTLTGGGVPWHREYSDSQYLSFYNGAWGLSIPAGQSEVLSLTLTIQGNNDSRWNYSGGYYYQLEASAS